MSESIFASHSKIGARYLTKTGHPIVVLSPVLSPLFKGGVVVRDELRGVSIKIYGDDLLYPYQPKKINKEAIQMANAEKKSGKSKKVAGAVRGGERGARKTSEGIILTRQIGNATHEVLFHAGVLTYRAKDYTTLKEVAEAIRGKAISGSGRSFFGLRTTGNVELGREVMEGLKKVEEKKPKAAKTVKKAPKTRRVKVDQDEDDGGVESKAKGPGVEAGLSAKGRGR